MPPLLLITLVLALSTLAYWQGRRRAFALSVQPSAMKMHSRPGYYGMLTALWCAVPALLIVMVWQLAAEPLLTGLAMKGLTASKGTLSPDQLNLLVNDLRNLVAGNAAAREIDPLLQATADCYTALHRISNLALVVVVLATALGAAYFVLGRIKPELRARNQVERAFEGILSLCSVFAVLITIGIVLSVLFESLRFFQQVPFFDFLFGLQWSPQMAIRVDQAGSSGSFGAIPVLAGTFLISGIAMAIAVPFGLMSAIYLSEYAGPRFRTIVKPLLEILAGIPTVVYGFFAALIVAPCLRDLGLMAGLSVASESALAAGSYPLVTGRLDPVVPSRYLAIG